MVDPVQVTLFSQRATRELMGRLVGTLARRKLSVLHVRGNPLSRTELGAAIDVSRYDTAICVLDQSWVRHESRVSHQTRRPCMLPTCLKLTSSLHLHNSKVLFLLTESASVPYPLLSSSLGWTSHVVGC